MKVAIYSPVYPPSKGGLEYVSSSMAESLTKLCDVSVFTTNVELGTGKKICNDFKGIKDGVVVKRYTPKIFSLCKLIHPQLYSWDLVKDLCEHKVDVIHLYGFFQFPMLLSILKYVKCPTILSPVAIFENSETFMHSLLRRFLLRSICKYISRKVVKVIASTSQYRELLISLGFDRKKIVNSLIHGINYNKFSHIVRKEEDLILCIGRYAWNKGFHILIESAKSILKLNPNLKFIIAGKVFDKKYYAKLNKMIVGEERIELKTNITEEEILNLYSRAKIFIFPSIADSFGIVNLEAMASGIPVIATKVGAAPSFLKNNIDGISIKPNNKEALTNAIIELLKNERKREFFSLKGEETVKKYGWDKIARETLKVYAEVKR
ncbi:glycosyltransferase family 4 protein [candidate division WOR-3 bacterium]|nr:glycosyltransferase family 4 protein [candidate division WOR-3 bacterium]